MTQLAGASDWPGNVLWIVAAVTWLIILAAYLASVAAQSRWRTGLSDPTFGLFTALIVIVPMLLGARLAEQAQERLCSGAAPSWWYSSVPRSPDWITVDGDMRRWPPGYFLPTAAGAC